MNDLFLPPEFTDMEFIDVIASPTVDGLGILIMGDHFEGSLDMPTIRVYQLKADGDDMFQIDKELEAFSFHDIAQARDFAARLPTMPAIELLVLMSSFVYPDKLN